ncbi:MAG TPA: hypothetical protein VL422_00050, partial [Miltoncostaea sp.]|nr:hypothetical protein [Miltoncostaea sp.]
MSDASVQVVRLRRGPGGPAVERLAAAVLAADSGAARVEALRGLVEAAGMKGAPAAATITGNDVVIRRLTLPVMKR